MKKNIGTTDRMIRVILGIVLIVLAVVIPLEGFLFWLFVVLGIVALLTAAISYCALYTLLGCNTCPAPKEQKK